jgi:integrase
VLGGKRYEVGIGSAYEVDLDEARSTAARIRYDARHGEEPAANQPTGRPALTFGEAAHRVHKNETAKSRTQKAAMVWLSPIANYALPTMGERPIADITSADLLNILEPIWSEKYPTAKKLLQRFSKIFNWAKSAGEYHGENPTATLREALPKVKHVERHHAAMPWQKAPEFYGLLCKRTGSTAALALRLIMLSGLRSKEGRAPEWSEFDFGNKTWTVPAHRMKDGTTDFIVPLTQPMLDILETMRGADPVLVFPSDNGKPLSVNAFRALYKRMNADVGRFTTHGFRSTIADWASEQGIPDELSEMVLSHKVGSQTRRAYKRSE